MGTTTGIGWCDHTANTHWGCVEVAPECDNCYAREWAKRYDRAKWGADEPRLFVKSVWTDLPKWQRAAAEASEVRRVFCGSMMDIFERPMPVVDAKGNRMGMTTADLRARMFNEVVPACPNLLFLFLTKRPSNITGMVPTEWLASPPPNVMYGTSTGTQKTANHALPALLKTPGRRFLSIEPLLELVTFGDLDGIEWGIPGCESNGSRVGRFAEGYEAAARSIIGQLRGAGAMVFHKQMPINGRVSHDLAEWPDDLREQSVPSIEAATFYG